MATGSLLTAAKARYGAAVAAVIGFVAPGAVYLLEHDVDGISGNEWLHALILSVVVAGGSAAAVGGTVYAVENRPKPGVLLGRARYVGSPRPDDADELDA